MAFNYTAPAELFTPTRKPGRGKPIGYRRFNTAAEAIRFAIEEFPPISNFGPWMQVGDERFNGEEIRQLYESRGYPLARSKFLI
jgi:hypothetical protein